MPRQQYSRELKIATMREIDAGKGYGARGPRVSAQSEAAREW